MKLKKDLNTQCIQFFVNILFIDKKRKHFVNNKKISKRNRGKTYFAKNFQFTLFAVK